MNLLMVWQDRLWVTYRYKCRTYREIQFISSKWETIKYIGLLVVQVSRQTPTLFLSLTWVVMLAKSENLEPMTFSVLSCMFKKSASCEWATIGLYHVFQNYFSAMKAIDLPVENLWYMESELLAWKSNVWKKEKKRGVILNVVQLQTQRFAQLQVRQ